MCEPFPGQFDDADEETLAKLKDPAFRNHNIIFDSKIHPLMREAFQTELDNQDEYSDYDNDEDEYEFDMDDLKRIGPNAQCSMGLTTKSSDEILRKFSGRISVEKYEGIKGEAATKLISLDKKMTANRAKIKDKQDRATVEQVIDPRTRMILYKLLSNEKILSIDGCISTGKEANVYHATGPDDTSYAIKIYKTSILTFKTRDKYVSGEFRFRQGYSKKNPRKMVRLWAEKEYRNLLRIHSSNCGINVPKPRILKSHVLVMDFIGEDGWPCPLLKDVKFEQYKGCTDEEQGTQVEFGNDEVEENNAEAVHNLLSKLYTDCLVILWRLYRHCRLVHADFSEFNLILKDFQKLYVIDVSQSVEHDHPRSLDFLRIDIKNIQEFFGKRHVLVGDFKDIFDWITNLAVDTENYDTVLQSILERATSLEEATVAEEVFRKSYIPKKMNEIENFEEDFRKLKTGNEELIYTGVLGMKPDFSGPQPQYPKNNSESNHVVNVANSIEDKDDFKSETDEESSLDHLSESENDEKLASFSKDFSRPKNETPEEKRERKKAVRDAKALKRQTKMKKHIKKRKEKLSHANSKK